MMTHDDNHPLSSDTEDPRGMATWAIGLGSAVVLLAFVLASIGMFNRETMNEVLEKSINIRFEDRNATRDAQHAVLDEEAHWVRERDPISGDIVDRLAIPIEDAMDIVAGQGGGP